MEAPKRGRGRPPKTSKTASEKVQEQQQQGAAAMMDVVEPAKRAGQVQEPTGRGGGGASAADSGAKVPKKRGREVSTERYRQPLCDCVPSYCCTVVASLLCTEDRQAAVVRAAACIDDSCYFVVAGCGCPCYARCARNLSAHPPRSKKASVIQNHPTEEPLVHKYVAPRLAVAPTERLFASLLGREISYSGGYVLISSSTACAARGTTFSLL